MKLKSFGCSFIFGSELSDDVSQEMFDWGCNGIYIRPSKLTWPALIADRLGYDYSCYALPGIGNLQILESILNQVQNSTPDEIFVIHWSWIDRFDYENLKRTPKENFWNTILPGDQNVVASAYFKHMHSQYRDKLSSLLYIKTAIDVLKQNNIRFLMTNLDNLVFEEEWHATPATILLQQSIKKHMFDFDGLNFLDWAAKNNYPISQFKHPLEEAHQAAASLILARNLI